jgi:hypothetical protein
LSELFNNSGNLGVPNQTAEGDFWDLIPCFIMEG